MKYCGMLVIDQVTLIMSDVLSMGNKTVGQVISMCSLTSEIYIQICVIDCVIQVKGNISFDSESVITSNRSIY